MPEYYDFTDFITGERKRFNFSERGGSTVSMYTRNTVNVCREVIPVHLGTINAFDSESFRTNFVSIPNGATYIKTSPVSFDTIYGPIRIRILDSLPEGITWRSETGAGIVFRGTNIQAIPQNVLTALQNPTNENYPVTELINNGRCYFRIKAERIQHPEFNSTWLYYFTVRTNWSIIRDTFISNTSSTFFSFDQKNFVSGEDFISTQKLNGYYL
jgi:hypothetical protein